MKKKLLAYALGLMLITHSDAAILSKAESGWKSIPSGKWKLLIKYDQSDNTIEEVEWLLGSSMYVESPMRASKSLTVVHVLEGEVSLLISGPKKENVLLKTDDVMILGPAYSVKYKKLSKATARVDVTFSKKIEKDNPLWSKHKHIPFAKQKDHLFLGNGGMQRFRMVVHPDEVDNLLSRSVFFVTPGENGPPFHTHPMIETFRMLKGFGGVEVSIGGDGAFQQVIGDGDYAAVLPGEIHSFRNLGKTETKFVATLAPAGAERIFLEFSRLYSELSSKSISKDDYLKGMDRARKTSTSIVRANGNWKSADEKAE